MAFFLVTDMGFPAKRAGVRGRTMPTGHLPLPFESLPLGCHQTEKAPQGGLFCLVTDMGFEPMNASVRGW